MLFLRRCADAWPMCSDGMGYRACWVAEGWGGESESESEVGTRSGMERAPLELPSDCALVRAGRPRLACRVCITRASTEPKH